MAIRSCFHLIFVILYFTGLSSSQNVGHICHVNLRDELFQYKEVIGHVMLNFSPRIKLVTTKINQIENKFRNLDLEILAGDSSEGFVTTVKENGCQFNESVCLETVKQNNLEFSSQK